MARKKKTCASAPPTAIDRSYSDDDESNCKSVGNGSNEAIDKLYAEIDQQREVISLLTTRLNFVLTMFGIEEIPVVFDKQNRSTGCDDADKKSTSATDTCYAPVVTSGKTVSPTVSFQSAVLSTLYKEKHMQELRNRNFVIHGLQDSPGDNDKEHVEKLCETKLNLKPDINTCKRLGKVIPGRVRPMLVTVGSDQQASAVISSARNLRKSNNSYVRDHVYINPDLTKAEAAAAYQARCQRQLVRAARNNSNNQHLNHFSSRQVLGQSAPASSSYHVHLDASKSLQ